MNLQALRALAFDALNALGNQALPMSGPVHAHTAGTPSILAESALPASNSQRQRAALDAENGRHILIGTNIKPQFLAAVRSKYRLPEREMYL
jgi:hypothetical protein